MFKALIVGCGKIAGANNIFGSMTHGRAYARQSNIDLVAAVDRDLIKARQFAGLFSCAYSSELIPSLELYAPDVVSVCTPDATHFDVVCEILSIPCAPRVIFLEKPACATQKQYVTLLHLAAKSGSVIVVNHSRRFSSEIRILRERISDGEFGRLHQASAIYYSGWMHNGTHVVDTLTFLLDDVIEVEQITGMIESPYQNDPTLEVVATLKRRRAPVVISAIDEALYQIFELDFWFENARLRLEDFCERVILERRIVNAIGECVLENSPTGLLGRSNVPMENAVGLIGEYLDSGDTTQLAGCCLEDIRPTMETLWEGRRLYEKTRS